MRQAKNFPFPLVAGLPALLAILLLWGGCAPAGAPDQELRKEIQSLKAEVASLKEAIIRLEGGQQAILELLKKPAAVPPPGAEPQAQVLPFPQGQPGLGSQVLSVSQLIAGKDKYLGSRVTVKGTVGPVLVHHKSLLLTSPEGMVEVFLDKLPDQKLVARLTTVPIETPLTATGIVSLPAKPGGAKLQISAEAVEF